jgi:hypothetical protein
MINLLKLKKVSLSKILPLMILVFYLPFSTRSQTIQPEIGLSIINPEISGRIYANSMYVQYKKFNVGIIGHLEYTTFNEGIYKDLENGRPFLGTSFTNYMVNGSKVINFNEKFNRGIRSEKAIGEVAYANVNSTSGGVGLLVEYNFLTIKNLNCKARFAPIIFRNRYQYPRTTYTNASVKKQESDPFIDRVNIKSFNIYEDTTYGAYMSLGLDYRLSNRIRVGVYTTYIGVELPYFSNFFSYSF